MSEKRVYTRTDHILLEILMILGILILVFTCLIHYISGPIAVLDHIDDEMQNKMMIINDLQGCQLISRFAEDDIYYVSECQNSFYGYKEDGRILDKQIKDAQINDFGIDELKSIIDSEYLNNTDAKDYRMGVYQNHLVYVLCDSKKEVLFDYITHDVLRVYDKG